MDERLLTLLEECLVDLEAGKSPDECLRRYPADAEKLRPLLQTAVALRALRPADPPAVVLAASRAGLMAQAASRRSRNGNLKFGSDTVRVPRPTLHAPRWTTALALTLLAVFAGILSAGMTRSLPGDPLYGVKRSIEDFELTLARSPDSEAAYNARRIEEINALVADRRVAEVEFWGEVSFTRPEGWQVGPIYVYGDENTRLSGNPAVGDTVSVRAVTRPDGTLLASQISVVSSQ